MANMSEPLSEFLETLNLPGIRQDAWRLGLVVTRGHEVEVLAPNIWAIRDWRLFGSVV